jgi:hypothetical protein
MAIIDHITEILRRIANSIVISDDDPGHDFELLSAEFIKQVFDVIRNFGLCAGVASVGIFFRNTPHEPANIYALAKYFLITPESQPALAGGGAWAWFSLR